MSRARKRVYNSEGRMTQAQETKQRILNTAQKLFQTKGLKKTTIGMIAKAAEVAEPTVYAAFKSKEGILKELANVILFGTKYQSLVDEIREESDPIKTLKMAAKISRTIYDSEKNGFELFRGAAAFSPEVKKIETANVQQRYDRQEIVILRLSYAKLLPRGMSIEKARDILWALTERELYRKLVQEHNWTSDEYEDWLKQLLVQALVAKKAD